MDHVDGSGVYRRKYLYRGSIDYCHSYRGGGGGGELMLISGCVWFSIRIGIGF